jgi:hypothetical protein
MDDGSKDTATYGVPIGAGEFAAGTEAVVFVPVLGDFQRLLCLTANVGAGGAGVMDGDEGFHGYS